MKKLLSLLLIAGMASFVACGPSKKDLEAKEKAKQDSVAAAEKAQKEADSLALIEKETKRLDSLKQDSIAKAEKKKEVKPQAKPSPKMQEQKIKEEIKKGRG